MISLGGVLSLSIRCVAPRAHDANVPRLAVYERRCATMQTFGGSRFTSERSRNQHDSQHIAVRAHIANRVRMRESQLRSRSEPARVR
jgi:hypothetical protein